MATRHDLIFLASAIRQRCSPPVTQHSRYLRTMTANSSLRMSPHCWQLPKDTLGSFPRSVTMPLFKGRAFSVISMLAEKHGSPSNPIPDSVVNERSRSSRDTPPQPQRHWSDTEPLDPSHLVNPNGRMYSVRPDPGPDATTIRQTGPLSNPPPSGADTTDDLEEEATRYRNSRPPSILWAVVFVVAVANLSYVGAAVYSYHDTRRIAGHIKEGEFSIFGSLMSFIGAEAPFEAEDRRLRTAKRHEIAERWGGRIEWLQGWCDQLGLPQTLKEFILTMTHMTAESYVDLPESKRVLVPIIATNTAVFFLWTVSSKGRRSGLYRMLNAHFVHVPSSRRFHSLLTSVFSHQSFIHFGCNNLVLWSFGGGSLLAPMFLAHYPGGSDRIAEASLTPHFLAFFVVAGVTASLVSHVGAAARWYAIASRYGTELAKQTVGRQGGLGASGAIYAVIVMSALSLPDARIGILFLPFFSLPIAQGVLGLVALDLIGIVRGWMLFDHLAHLGGAAFGALYWFYGAELWELTKRFVEDEEKDLAIQERDRAMSRTQERGKLLDMTRIESR